MIEMNNKKIAVITGASKGIGRSVADILLARKYTVINLSRSKPSEKSNSIFIKTDVSNELNCKKSFDKIVKKFGRIDILVNSAGVLTVPDDITNLKSLKKHFEPNMFGSFYCSHFAAKQMKKQGYGQIVNISSTSGVSFKESQLSYIASKWAVTGFSGSLRLELQKHGIDVICFCPGGTKTDLFRHMEKGHAKDFMDPKEVAGKIVEVMEREDKNKWLFIYTRKERILKGYSFEDYPLP